MVEGVNFSNLAIHGKIFLDDDSDLAPIADIFSDIKSIDLPDGLDSQIVNIDDDDLTNSALILADQLPEDPVVRQSSIDLVAISFEDDDLSISIDASHDMIDLAIDIFDIVLSRKEAHILSFDMEYSLDSSFSELPISTEAPEIFVSKGVKLADENYEYIIQSTDSGPWLDNQTPGDEKEETEESSTSVHIDSKGHFNVNESGEFINKRKQEIEDSLEVITQ